MTAFTHKFQVEGREGFLHITLDERGQPAGIIIRMCKEGSFIAGLMDCFAAAITLCLKQGVPLATLCNSFIGRRFEPSGYTSNTDIPRAKSVVDYVFLYLKRKFHVP